MFAIAFLPKRGERCITKGAAVTLYLAWMRHLKFWNNALGLNCGALAVVLENKCKKGHSYTREAWSRHWHNKYKPKFVWVLACVWKCERAVLCDECRSCEMGRACVRQPSRGFTYLQVGWKLMQEKGGGHTLKHIRHNLPSRFNTHGDLTLNWVSEDWFTGKQLFFLGHFVSNLFGSVVNICCLC